MSSPSDVIDRWVDVQTGRATRNLSYRNILIEGNRLYSYGRHFELARALFDADGELRLWLINGDTFSNTTNRHQRTTRNSILRAGGQSVIVPFSVLDAAGIDFDTVHVLEALRDRTVTTSHSSPTMPEGARWVVEPVMGYVEKSDAEIEEVLDGKHATAVESWERRCGYAESGQRGWLAWKAEHPTAPDRPTRESLTTMEQRTWTETGTSRRLMIGRGASWRQIEVTVTETPTGVEYTWETSRHWLGESLISGNVTDTRRIRCRPCKGERYRQCDRCHGRGGRTVSKIRSAKFLSGFDRGETRPSYFFCELPATDAVTVEDAYEALKPDTVRMAEQMGRTVFRQGDIFAVELSGRTTRAALRRAGATFEKRGQLLGTNHEATEVALLPDGTTVARGCLYHAPGSWRRPDHARVSLGSGFHVIVKNTVPLAA